MSVERPRAGQETLAGCLLAGGLLAMGVVLGPADANAAQWEFDWRATLAGSWTDNVELAPDGLEESEWITELRPGFTLQGQGSRFQATLDYDVQALWFADNSDFNDVYHQASGTGNFVLAPESLFLDAFLRYDQQNIDTTGRVGHSNLFATGNRTDAFVFGASPYHTGRYGNWAESLLRLDYLGVRYTNTDATTVNVEDADTAAVSAWFGSPEARRGLSWRTSGSYSRTEFEEAREFEYGRVALDLGVPAGARTRLTARGGFESDVQEDPSEGGLDAPFWFAGFNWDPDELQSLEASIGNRYFGTAYEASYSRRGSRGTLELGYTEQSTTASQLFGDDGIFRPGSNPQGNATLDTRVFLSKRFSGSASYELVRSSLNARIYSDRRTYQDGSGDTEDVIGAGLGYDWKFSQRTTVGLSTYWEQRDFDGAEGSDDSLDLSLRITRTITRTLSGALRFAHVTRDSDIRETYDANVVTLSLEGRF